MKTIKNLLLKGMLTGMTIVSGLSMVAPSITPIYATEEAVKETSNQIDSSLYFWYNNCTKSQKKIYNQLLKAIQEANDEDIYLDEECSEKELKTIETGIYYDHPELFWYSGTYYTISKDEKIIGIQFEYNDYVNNLEANKKTFEDKVQEILNETKDDNLVQQELKIHDYIAKNMTYKKGTHDQSAYSGIVEQETVCAGFSRSFQYLMQRSGVPCYFCTGDLYDENTNTSQAHGWNIIQLGNNYYNVDITTDQQLDDGYIMYEEFNATDADIDKNHTRYEESKLYPECTSNEYSYKNITGQTNLESVAKQVNAQEVNSLNEYYQVCYEKLMGHGAGVVDFRIAIKDKDVFNQINNSITNMDDIDGYASKASDDLGLEDANWSVKTNYSNFNDGTILHITLKLE